MKRTHNPWLTAMVSVAAVAVVLVFFLLTPQGTALAESIVKFFSPQKQMDTEIEGGTETQNGQLETNTSDEIGYVIYIDAERYVKESSGGVDYYKALDMPEGYPPVQMEITQVTDMSAETQYEALLKEAQEKYDVVEDRGQVKEPLKGRYLFAYDDGGAEAPYEDIYVVDNTKGGCFVIRCKLFREATEGHGARYYAMLKTFEVVKSSQVETAQPQPSAPAASATPQQQVQRLTWDNLTIYGVKLDIDGQQAVDALSKAIGDAVKTAKAIGDAGKNAQPISDETQEDAGGKTRTVKWEDGTIAVVRNGKLYSIETTSKFAPLPFDLRVGMSLAQFTAMLGEPHEAIDAVAWGVGSNDNLIVKTANGCVTSAKISLTE